ncbi:hypothetical protein ASA1KI_35200 [Opitutales bacterium ASA1]|uniref:hypothetical protein n=1 Tax=Congregicoccus parvus TaxID=3081749 RepID=UPI002B2CC8C5|nr:hypothetical protein ASA1KI_35200 [Opitutales bacterium ASA1]
MVTSVAGQRTHPTHVEIDLILHLEGRRTVVPVAQNGRGFLVTSFPTEAPPTDAELVLRVDGREQRRAIRLPDGSSRESRLSSIS